MKSWLRRSLPFLVFTLAVGALSETVSVEAAAPHIEPRSPSIGTVIENERIEELPLNGRNPVDLITLAGPAVPQPALHATSRSIQGGPAVMGQWVEANRDMNVTCPGISADLGRWFHPY